MKKMPTFIILAAGQGTRLRPLTDGKAKCTVPLHGRSLLHWQIAVAKKAGFKNIVVVRGYAANSIQAENVIFVDNPAYATTNMPISLLFSREHWGDEFVVSYGDIVYEESHLNTLLASPHDISVIVDLDWKSYWEQRFENILNDAETLQYDSEKQIQEIGKKAKAISEIQAQYIGLLSFKNTGITALKELFEREQKAFAKGGFFISREHNLNQLYMTDVLQGLIDWGTAVHAIPVRGKWLEIDSLRDLHLAEKIFQPTADIFTINRM